EVNTGSIVRGWFYLIDPSIKKHVLDNKWKKNAITNIIDRTSMSHLGAAWVHCKNSTISPDSRVIALSHHYSYMEGSQFKQAAKIELIDIMTGDSIWVIDLKNWWTGVSSIDFSPDGKILAVGGPYKLKFLEVASGEEIFDIKKIDISPSPVYTKFTPDMRLILVACGGVIKEHIGKEGTPNFLFFNMGYFSPDLKKYIKTFSGPEGVTFYHLNLDALEEAKMSEPVFSDVKTLELPEVEEPKIEKIEPVIKGIDITNILLELPEVPKVEDLPPLDETPLMEPIEEMKIEIGTAETVAKKLLELNRQTPDIPSEYVFQGIRFFRKEIMDQLRNDEDIINYYLNNKQQLLTNPIARKAFVSKLINEKGASEKELWEELDSTIGDLIDKPLKKIEKMMNKKGLQKLMKKREKYDKQKEKSLKRIDQEIDEVCKELLKTRKIHGEAFEKLFETFNDLIKPGIDFNEGLVYSLTKIPAAFKEALDQLQFTSDVMRAFLADKKVYSLIMKLNDLINKKRLVQEGILINPAI
ncbi:MAG: WD40 repeat domain-containing protein, partial [Candidatus Helarchaeota archaeon]